MSGGGKSFKKIGDNAFKELCHLGHETVISGNLQIFLKGDLEQFMNDTYACTRRTTIKLLRSEILLHNKTFLEKGVVAQ